MRDPSTTHGRAITSFYVARRQCVNNNQLTQTDNVKYPGIHLDGRLTWRKHITTKRKQLYLKLCKLYWIIGRWSQLSLENKLLVYKAILKPNWSYGIQLWRSASNSTIDILERFWSKVLWIITDALWYVPNVVITCNLQVPTVRQAVRTYSVTYRQRLTDRPNRLASSLLQGPRYTRRLKCYYPEDLAATFN
jgi:hypothetical protein